MHYFMFIVTALIWGGVFFLMKKAGFAFGPLTIGAAGTFGGALVMWIFWAVKREPWQMSRKHISPLIGVTVMGYIFPFAAQPFLIKLIGHGFIGMMISLVPILTIVVSIPLLKVFPSRTQLVGVLLGIVCIGLMVLDGLDRNAGLFHLMLAVSVPVSYAVSNTMVQKYFQKVSPILTVALFMTVATAVLTPLAISFETITIDENFWTAVGAVIILSVFGRGIAMLFFYKLIQSKGPLFAGMVTYVTPAEALIWSWFDHERISSIQLLAIVVVLLVVGVVQRDIVRRGRLGDRSAAANVEV